ncbi:3'-5' exonuclease [Alistipes timonensis]
MAAPAVTSKIFTGIVLDFETGGLDCTTSACTQIALQAVRLDTWQLLDRYARYIAPYNREPLGGGPRRKVLHTRREQALILEAEPMRYEQTALDITGITMEQLRREGEDLKKIAAEVLAFAGRNTLTKGPQYKPVLIGQNIPFDIGFLQQMMAYAGLTTQFAQAFAGTTDFFGNFQPRYIDTLDLGHMAFAGDSSVGSYKLELIAERLGVELADAHDADADVTATREVAALYAARLGCANGAVNAQEAEKTRTHFKI